MKKQTQSRQYGYVSPKCKFASLPCNMVFCASPDGWNQGGAGSSGSVNEVDEEV